MGMPLLFERHMPAGCVHSTDKSFNSPDRIGRKELFSVGDEISGDAGYCASSGSPTILKANTAGNSSTL